jgi:hypothetical protein
MKDNLQFPEPGAPLEEVIRFQEQLLEHARETDDRQGEGRTLLGIGLSYLQLGETRTGFECLGQALKIAVETGDVSTQGNALFHMSMATMSAGVVNDDTLNMARAALKIFERTGDPTAELVKAVLAKYE